jgi:hypothetical protein
MSLLTFKKHPEEGCEMEVSEDDLTDAPNMDGVDVVIAVNQALKL